MKKKILVYIPSFAGGSAERVFMRIANEMLYLGQAIRFDVNDASGPIRPLLSQAANLTDLGVLRTRQAIRPLARLLTRAVLARWRQCPVSPALVQARSA